MTAEELWRFALSLSSVAFPLIVIIFRFKKIDGVYFPFLIYIVISFLNELLVGLVIGPHNVINVSIDLNLFSLFEAIILLLQFKYWRRFDLYSKLFPEFIFVIIFGWAFENLIISTITHFNVFFLIAYSFILVLLAVQTINHIIVNESKVSLLKSPIFIICVGIIIFFIYTIFVHTLMAKGIDSGNRHMMIKVFSIKVYVNALANILYGIALLFVQKKVRGKDLFKDLQ